MTLGVDGLKAKWMLSKFLEQHRSKSDSEKGELSATFCVAGESKDPATGNAQMQLRLVREAKVEEAKNKLCNCIGVYVYR